MQTLTHAPASLLDLIIREGGLQDLNTLNPAQKSDLFTKLGVVHQLLNATYTTKGAITATNARVLNVGKSTISLWLKTYNTHGFRGLIDGRKASAKGRALLPDITAQWIKDKILRTQRNDGIKEVHRQILDQWNLWRRTGDPQWAIPGFTRPPLDCGKGFPAGLSYESVRRCKPTDYQASLSRQGTISAYRTLPSILSTCVDTRYLEYVFFDDEKPDVNVRVPGFDRPMVPLAFHAIERITRYPFAPHVRLRWYDVDENTHKHLTQKEFVWYVIWLLCTEGYRTDERGTTLIQEHGTAKVWSNKMLRTPDGYHSFGDAVKALTSHDGMPGVRMDDSGLFNKPAFKELLYGPKSSGNPRFKAPIESSFHLWRTYSLPLIGQTGRNVEMAPEENYGIDQYERRILKAAKDLPANMRDGLLSNYLTGFEFGSFVELIREALASRTDHDFEGWGKMNFMEPVWRWKDDRPGIWRPRSELANLPQHLREHALHEQKQDPRLSEIIPWSPTVARLSCQQDSAISKLSFQSAVHLLPTEWAKQVKVRDRHQIHLTEELLPGEELIYLPELTTPRGRTEYLSPGDELMVYLNPLMPDMVLVCDMSFQFLGTITRNVRIGHDNDQLEEMYKQRARLKGALEAPVRRAMQPVADRRAAVADLNKDYLAQARDVTPSPPTTKPARPGRTPYVDPLSAPLAAAPAVSEPEADPFL
jgi:hypothetical protein